MANDKIVVGIADMKLAKDSGMLVTYALGSCIGICFYDTRIHLAALLHIMLPLNMETKRRAPLKYADTGIRATLQQMEAQGASRSRITAKIAGGAKMFEVSGSGTWETSASGTSTACTGCCAPRAFAWWPRMWAAKWPAPCCLMWLPASAASAVMASQN